MELQEQIRTLLQQATSALGVSDVIPTVDMPADPTHGDYTCNVAMQLSKRLQQSPMAIAEMLVAKIVTAKPEIIARIEVAPPGFINIWLTHDTLLSTLSSLDTDGKVLMSSRLTGKRIMVEYAHPNTHKEMHIGHMRTLITGEAISRLLEAAGATVFRANYQGDIGPHVAKAVYGLKLLTQNRAPALDDVRQMSASEKAHVLGQAYAAGSQAYTEHKEEIDQLNTELYTKSGPDWDLYQETRQWSLDYYDGFYKRFSTHFDRLFFESEVDESGKRIVEENVGKVFEKDNGAIVFKGESYGLHTRVFITQAGNPTYEGKEMGNAYAEYDAFPFDLKMHVVANEQAGYFQVVFKALELIDPAKFKDKQHHVSMGMVQLADRKMSSRTGDVLTVDWLLDEVKGKAKELFASGRVNADDLDAVVEQITVGAVKYSVLKVGTGMNAAFDIEISVSLDGNSGPYLQYTFARTQSVLAKLADEELSVCLPDNLTAEETLLLRELVHFSEIVISAAERYSPNMLATYLFGIAKQFNLFYQHCPILKETGDVKSFRVFLTARTGEILKKGLDLLGIQAPTQM